MQHQLAVAFMNIWDYIVEKCRDVAARWDRKRDEIGEVSPWNVFWGLVFLFFLLLILNYFGII
jgi:hypothetical protein